MSVVITEFRYHTETINGVEREKPVPKRLHAILMRRIMAALESALGADAQWDLLPELDVLCGTDRYCPDIVVARSDAAYQNGMLNEGAELAVEILSPGQTVGQLLDKADVYVHHGTRCVWVIWGERRQAWIYTKASLIEVRAGESLLTPATPLPFEGLPIDTLFRAMPG